MALCTLTNVIKQLQATVTYVDPTQEDSILAGYLEAAADQVEAYCGRWFLPWVGTYGFNGEVGDWNSILNLRDRDLAAPTQVLNGNNTVLDPSLYTLLPIGVYPKKQVRIAQNNYWKGPNDPPNNSCGPVHSWLPSDGYAEDAIQITGIWVFHRWYNSAHLNSQLTVATTTTAGQLTLTLSAAAGAAIDVGDTLRIDSEYFTVVGPLGHTKLSDGTFASVISTATTVNVIPGYRGSTLAAHNSGTAIYVWQPEPVIRLAASIATAALYVGRNNPDGSRMRIPGMGAVEIPVDIPDKVRGLLSFPFYSHYYGRAPMKFGV